MCNQDIFSFLWVDVNAARNDHKRLAIGEVQEAFVIKITNVTQGRPTVGMMGVRCFFRIVEILELAAAFKIHATLRAPRQFLTEIIDDMDLAIIRRLAHRARVLEPFFSADKRRAIAFCACIVLADNGSPPIDHLMLDTDRAGCGGMNRTAQTRKGVSASCVAR